MMRHQFKYSYATQRLMENGFKLYNQKRILKYPLKVYPHWKLPVLETRIQKGKPLFSGNLEKFRILTVYDDLHDYGIMISKRRPTSTRFYAQKVEYFLTKRSNLKPDVGDIPEGHYVQLDQATKSFRLVGKNSTKDWFVLHPKRVGYYQERRSIFDTTGRTSSSNILKKYIPNTQVEKPEFTETIPEIVLGITPNQKILCIQEEKENPTIGIVGKKRFGKSMTKHRIMDCIYNKWGKKCIELNDEMMETDSYCQTWQPIKIFSNLELINEVSYPLPMVYLHPNTRTLRDMIGGGQTGFKIYLDYMEFVQDFNNIMKGKDDIKFKGSNIYFENLIYDSNGDLDKEGLAYCKNPNDMDDTIDRKFSQSKDKVPDGVPPRIKNVLRNIYNSKIWDISNDTKAKWTVEFPDGRKERHYPWTAALIADLVPSIVTNNIFHNHKEIHPQYANFILNDLLKNQLDNEYFRKNQLELFVFFDEIISLVNSPVAVETLETFVRESGHARAGFTYCTQFWDKVPKFIQSQTDYVISFNQNKIQAKAICEDFDAMRYKQKELVNLKKGECIVFSPNKLVLYDEYGEREEIDDEPIKITIFPSLSSHKAPKAVGV